MIRGVHLAQVVDRHPEEYEVSVYLPYLAPALLGKGLRVRLGGQWQQPQAGEFILPRIGDWGLVAFYTEDASSGVWVASIPDRAWHIVPQELFKEDPDAALAHWPGGQWVLHRGDGSSEVVWPDGTFLQATRKGRSWLGRILERFRTKRTPKPWVPPERQPYQPPPGPRVYLYLRHASGAEIHVAQDGSIRLRTPTGHTFTLDEGEFGHRHYLTWQHAFGHVITLDPDGITVSSAGNIRIVASGNVVIDGSSIAIG